MNYLNMNSFETQFSSNTSHQNPLLLNLNEGRMKSFQNLELVPDEPEEKHDQINFGVFQDLSVHEIISSESEPNKEKIPEIELNEHKEDNKISKEKHTKKIKPIKKIFEVIKIKKTIKKLSKSGDLEKKGEANSFDEEFENQNSPKEKNAFIGKKRNSNHYSE